jgi:hypothetical protein
MVHTTSQPDEVGTMTRAFERFLRSFSDEELLAFARDRGAQRPPYWRTLRVALAIELDRRGLAAAEAEASRDGEAPAGGRPLTAVRDAPAGA